MSTKDEIFEYVMKTPFNTNPAVLKSKLNGLSAAPVVIGLPSLSITKPQDCVMSVTTYAIKKDDNGNYVKATTDGTNYIPDLQLQGSAHLYGFYAQISADDDIYNVTVNGSSVSYNSSSHKYMIQKVNSTYDKDIEVVVTSKPGSK